MSYRWFWLMVSASLIAMVSLVAHETAGQAWTRPASYTIWPKSAAPKAPPTREARPTEVGLQFSSSSSGKLTALRFFKTWGNSGTHVGHVWGPDGKLLATATFKTESSRGWQQVNLSRAVTIEPGKIYTASYTAPRGRYAADPGALSPRKPRVARDLTALRGVYSHDGGRPTTSSKDANHYVDVRFTPDRNTRPGRPPTSTATGTPTTPGTTTTTTTAPKPSTSSSSTTSTTPTRTSTSTSSTSSTRPTTPTSSSSSSSSSSSTSTPPPTSGGRTGCASRPSSCGYADATNTGLSNASALQTSGCVNASRDNQVVENLSISGCTISVTGKNVVIRNVKMSLSAVDTFAIIVRSGASATIQNVEIGGLDKSTRSVQYAILSQTTSRVTVDRANLYNCADCIQGEAMVVTNSYIHDLANPPGAHVDGFQCNSSCGVTLRHNTIFNEWDQTAAIALFADFGTPRNSEISDNLLAGGGYTVYGGGSNATNISIVNNRFARIFSSKSGHWGPGTQFAGNTGNSWSGNIWDDTGATVSRP